MVENLTKKKIIATLEFGAIYTGAILVFFWMAFISCFLGATTLLLLINVAGIELLIGAIIFYLVGISILIVLMINRYRLKQIKKWQEDAVELIAQSMSIENSFAPGILPIRTTKIVVMFRYKDKRFRIPSGKSEGFWSNDGSAGIFKKYADREIRIMFSPRYNQVMILKD